MFADYKVGDTAFKDYPCVTLLYVITIVFAESENSVSCKKSIISFALSIVVGSESQIFRKSIENPFY